MLSTCSTLKIEQAYVKSSFVVFLYVYFIRLYYVPTKCQALC